MQGQPDRVEQFKADIADLRISDPSTARDQLSVRVGLGGMAVGVVLPIVAYFMSHGTTNALTQRDALVLAVMGLAFAAGGGALYLKGSLAGFLRFWLVRDLHERRAQTDRLLAQLGGGEQPGESEPS
jgi:hypothetical protein